MTHTEQHHMIEDLRDAESRMTKEDLEIFIMFRKRDRDDEDLDNISRKKLVGMHEKYVKSKQPKGNPLDALFKKK